MKTNKYIRNNRAGSTIITALLTLTLLSFVGATVLMTVSSRYNYTQKAVGWEEALGAAEAGVDDGLANCRRTVASASANPPPPVPWTGWKKFNPGSGKYDADLPSAADADLEFISGRKIVRDLTLAPHLLGTGQGTTDLWYRVEVDAPASFVIGGNQWYRIRSTGYAGLTGLARADNDSPDGAKTHNDTLRKFDLRVDHFIKRYGDSENPAGTIKAVATPQAARRIEVIAQPKGRFGIGMVTINSPSSPTVDSYNSTDLVHYPGGQWNAGARNVGTGVGVNATVYIASAVGNSTVSSPIYGNVSTNGGTVTKTANISGTVNNTINTTIPPVTKPSWATVAGNAQTTLTATTGSTIYRSWGSLNNLTVNMPAGSPAGATGTVKIYVTGNIAGQITVAKGVTLAIFFEGNASVFPPNNLNNNAVNMQFYGINPLVNQTKTFWILGSNIPDGFVSYFTVDAPSYDMTNDANPNLCGAWIAKSINDNGKGLWHEDEALANAGEPTDYKRAMWVEDER